MNANDQTQDDLLASASEYEEQVNWNQYFEEKQRARLISGMTTFGEEDIRLPEGTTQ